MFKGANRKRSWFRRRCAIKRAASSIISPQQGRQSANLHPFLYFFPRRSLRFFPSLSAHYNEPFVSRLEWYIAIPPRSSGSRIAAHRISAIDRTRHFFLFPPPPTLLSSSTEVRWPLVIAGDTKKRFLRLST